MSYATWSATGGAAITPSDTTKLSPKTRGIAIGTAGDLTVVMRNGETLTFPSGSLAAGVIHPLQVSMIKSTGTTATGIVAVW